MIDSEYYAVETDSRFCSSKISNTRPVTVFPTGYQLEAVDCRSGAGPNPASMNALIDTSASADAAAVPSFLAEAPSPVSRVFAQLGVGAGAPPTAPTSPTEPRRGGADSTPLTRGTPDRSFAVSTSGPSSISRPTALMVERT